MERRHLILLSILILLLAFSGWIYFAPNTEYRSSFNQPSHPITSTSKQQLTHKLEDTASSSKVETELDSDQTSNSPYIITCEFIDESEDALDNLDEMSDEFDKYLESTSSLSSQLAANTDVNSQLVLAFMVDISTPDKRVELLKNILDKDPSNKLANWDLLNTCSSPIQTKCTESMLENAKEIHHQNAAMWLSMVNTAQQRSDTSLTEEGLKHLIAEPSFNDYYSEYLITADKAFRAAENGKLTDEQSLAIFHIAVQSIPPFVGILEFCRKNTLNKDHLSNLCLEAGKRMSFSSNTAISRMIGYAIQKDALTNLGNEVELESLKIKRDKAAYYDSILWKKASSLIKYDPELYERWFRNLVELGENEAAKLLIEEAIELSKDVYYQPCEVSG